MKTKMFLFLTAIMFSATLSAQGVCTTFVAKFGISDSANVVKFKDSSSINGNASNVYYTINWGDGNSYNSQSKPNTQTHAYPTTGGTYNICFKVQGYVGNIYCADSTCKSVTICPIFTPSVANTVPSKCASPCSGSIYFTGLKPNTIHYIQSWYYNGAFQQFTSLYSFTTNANGAGVLNGLCPGQFQGIKIWINQPFSCSVSVSGVATIGLTSTLAATLSIQHILPPNAGKIKIKATGGTKPYTYQWSNNAGNVDSIFSTSVGYYCVTVTDSVGCKKTLCDSLLNNNTNACSGTPIVGFISGSDSVCPNTQFTLAINMGNQTGYQYLWQYTNDTNTSWSNLSSNNPYVSITSASTGCVYYRVKVYCTNSSSFAYSHIRKMCVKNCSSTAKPCDSLKSITYTKVCNQVTFEAKNAPAGHTASYSWYFSNNTTGQGKVITKTFINGGYYAKLYYCLYNPNQVKVCCDSTIITFSVNCNTTNPCADVKAKFSVSTNGANAIFTDSSKYPPNMALTYQWAFGDGNSSTLKNPTNTYANAGTYTVRLIVTGWFSNSTIACKDTTYKVVQISIGNPCAKLIPYFTTAHTGNSVKFTNMSAYNGLGKVGVLWVFGDGTSSTLTDPTHLYANSGAFNVTLNVTAFDTPSGTTCIKSYSMWIQSNNNPCAGFDARYTYTKNFLSLSFTNTSIGTGTSTIYSWNFGNGNTSSAANPSYTYPLPGLYKVVLKVTTTIGTTTCTDSAYYFINIHSSNPCKDSGYVSYFSYQCYNYISPICGCDGITYKNYCEAQKAGVKQYTQGPCPNDTTYVKICGNVYLDLNYNCIKDSLENGINGIQIKLSGAGGTFTTYTNAHGYYQFYALKGTYSIAQNLSSSNYYFNNLHLKQLCPAANGTINVNAAVGGNMYCGNNFFDTLRNCLDLSISIHKAFNITPGFHRYVILNYKNNSPFAVSNVKVKYRKNTVQNFVSSIPTASSVSGNVYTWNIGTMNANQGGSIKIKLFTPVSVPIGTPASDTAWIEPDSADCEIGNNRAILKDSCRSSWDPNDKAVSPQGEGLNGDIPKETRTLDYLVRFQNKGNAPAFNIIVADQLDQNLDWTTLKIHAVSHAYDVFMDDNGKLIFEFKDIMLPDENTDEPGSHGFINYSIDIKDNKPVGTEIKNTAAILFDFNDPVITNTTINTLVEKTTGIIDLFKGQMEVKVSPNPMQEVANFIIKSTSDDKLNVRIADISGKLIRQFEIDAKEGSHVTSIPVSNLSAGIYLVNIQSSNHQSQSFKIIKE